MTASILLVGEGCDAGWALGSMPAWPPRWQGELHSVCDVGRPVVEPLSVFGRPQHNRCTVSVAS